MRVSGTVPAVIVSLSLFVSVCVAVVNGDSSVYRGAGFEFVESLGVGVVFSKVEDPMCTSKFVRVVSNFLKETVSERRAVADH